MDLCETAIEIPSGAACRPATRSLAKPFVSRRFYAACVALIVATGAAAAPTASAPADPTGEWRVAKGVATIRVVNCDGQFWGIVAWEQYPGIDKKNPDPTKRGRPTLGMPILMGMSQSGVNEWSGEIYNSEDGRTYSAKISLPNTDTLQVQGCVLGILCGGEKWTRVNPESTTGVAPGSSRPPTPSGARTTTPLPTPRPTYMPSAASPSAPAPASAQLPSPRTQSADDICLALVGPAGGTHQRGLK